MSGSSSSTHRNGVQTPTNEDVVLRRSNRIAARNNVNVVRAVVSPSTALGRGGSLRVPTGQRATDGNVSNVNVSEVANAISACTIGTGNIYTASSVTEPMMQDSNNNKGLPLSTTIQKEETATMESSALLKNIYPGNCQFCYIDLLPEDGVMIQECLHVFCKDCLQSAIESQKESCVIPCPIAEERQCGGFLSDAEAKELVAPEVYQEYLDRSLEIARKKMKNVFTCKNPGNCTGWCEFEEGRKTFDCHICKQINCMECQTIHMGLDCSTYQSLLQSGGPSKVKEVMEREKNSGWGQLSASMKASGDSAESTNEMIAKMEADLILNTKEFECPICFSDVAIGDGIILHECVHLFCRGCLVSLVEHNEEATVKCPYIDGNLSCVCLMQPREIKALLPPEIYEKHLQRSVKLGESSIQNSFHCKTPDCPEWIVYEVGATRWNCPTCKKSNCITCNAIHTGSCEDYKNQLNQNANDKLSEEAVEVLIKQGKAMRCPKCKIPVEKTAGCDWILCMACRTEICWITRGPRWGPKGYGDNTGGCRCKVNGKKCHPKCGNCH